MEEEFDPRAMGMVLCSFGRKTVNPQSCTGDCWVRRTYSDLYMEYEFWPAICSTKHQDYWEITDKGWQCRYGVQLIPRRGEDIP